MMIFEDFIFGGMGEDAYPSEEGNFRFPTFYFV